MWKSYFKSTKNNPPNKLLVLANAVPYVNGKKALDLGAGTLNDSKYLVEQGFTVDAVDSAPEFVTYALKEKNPLIHIHNYSFSDFPFPPDTYDLISAQWALSFEAPNRFDTLIANIRKALKPGGIFTGHIYGNRHAWASSRSTMTFKDNFWYQYNFQPLWHSIYSKEVEEIQTPVVGKPGKFHYWEFVMQK